MSATPLAFSPSGTRSFGLLSGGHGILVRRRLDRLIMGVPAVTASYLSKLSVPPFGGLGLSLGIPLLCLTSALGLAAGRLVTDFGRLLAYIALLCLLWGIQLLRAEPFSYASLLLFTMLHFPYVLQLKRAPDYSQVLALYQRVALSIAALGMLQYGIQFLIGPALAFPIENFFPEAFKVSKFNMQGYLEYGSEVYRTNGVFMLEPSFYSQLLAVGVVIEAVTRARAWVLIVLLAGMVVSFSGTGLMLLAACLPCQAIVKRRWDLLAAGVVLVAGAVTLAALLDSPYLNVFFKRAGEFTATGSSGFARFVGGFYLFEQFLWPDVMRGLFGFGAGSLQAYQAKATWSSGGNAFFKMIFEFGLVGGLAYFTFIGYVLRHSAAPVMLRVAVGFTYLLSGVYIPFSHSIALGLLVWPHAGTLAARAASGRTT
ncbi:MAG: hypothetical protein ACKVOX_13440 [Rhizobacter sp.]